MHRWVGWTSAKSRISGAVLTSNRTHSIRTVKFTVTMYLVSQSTLTRAVASGLFTHSHPLHSFIHSFVHSLIHSFVVTSYWVSEWAELNVPLNHDVVSSAQLFSRNVTKWLYTYLWNLWRWGWLCCILQRSAWVDAAISSTFNTRKIPAQALAILLSNAKGEALWTWLKI